MLTATATNPATLSAYERMLTMARAAGCPADQVRNFLRSGIVLQPRQLLASAAARLADRPNGPTMIGFGGARGGGKSYWMLAQMGADDCQRHSGMKFLLLRKVGKAVREGFEDLLPQVLQGLRYRYIPSRMSLEFPHNGSQIILGHFQNESDIDAYLGLEYDGIGVEEATTLTLSKLRMIRTTARTSKPDWRPRLYFTTNPGGIGHAWFKQMFIDPSRKGAETDTRFIASTVDDNRFVNREYKATLDSLTGWQNRAWRWGDWDIAAGQYFTNFKRETHVVPAFPIPRHWRVWAAMDYGFTHYTVVYLMAEDGDGNLYVIDEHAERKWVEKQHADAIKAMLQRHGLSVDDLSAFVAGLDVFSKKSDGASIAEKYQELGIKLTPANNDRINGAAEILSRLGNVDAGISAHLFIMDRCARLADCIAAMMHDPNRPEDVLKVDTDDEGQGGDDYYDGCRYGVMAATRPLTGGLDRSPLQGYRG